MSTAETKLLDAAGDYLREKGFSPLVAGDIRVQQLTGMGAYTYELVIQVLGKTPRLCPVHNMPDCSPMLNGCSELTNGR